MKKDIDTGGSAFPVNPSNFDATGAGDTGMTLRDYFSAKALQGMLANPEGLSVSLKQIAKDAYTIADAMIKERGK